MADDVRARGNSYDGYRNHNEPRRRYPPMTDEGLSVKKSVFAICTVVGCFAILWPYVFYPILIDNGNNVRPGPIDKTTHIKQERSAHLRPDAIHPAFRERGRAIPVVGPAPRPVPKPKFVDGRPGPVPGFRPTLGGAGHVVSPQKSTGYDFMGILMSLYTIAFLVFFVYTICKLRSKKKQEAPLYPRCESDERFHKEVFEDNNRPHFNRPNKDKSKIGHKERDASFTVRSGPPLGDEEELDQLRKRLRETELALERIFGQMTRAPLASQQDEVKVNGSLPKDEDQGTVTVMGMETRASAESGKKWSRPDSPVLPHPSPAPPKEPSPPPQQIFLEGALPPQSQILVADSAIEAQKEPEDDSPVVLAGKMTLSVISLDSETGTEESSNSGKKSEDERRRSSSNTSEDFEKINATELEEQIDSIIEQAESIALAEENKISLNEELDKLDAADKHRDILDEIKEQLNLEDDLLQSIRDSELESSIDSPLTDIVKDFLESEQLQQYIVEDAGQSAGGIEDKLHRAESSFDEAQADRLVLEKVTKELEEAAAPSGDTAEDPSDQTQAEAVTKADGLLSEDPTNEIEENATKKLEDATAALTGTAENPSDQCQAEHITKADGLISDDPTNEFQDTPVALKTATEQFQVGQVAPEEIIRSEIQTLAEATLSDQLTEQLASIVAELQTDTIDAQQEVLSEAALESEVLSEQLATTIADQVRVAAAEDAPAPETQIERAPLKDAIEQSVDVTSEEPVTPIETDVISEEVVKSDTRTVTETKRASAVMEPSSDRLATIIAEELQQLETEQTGAGVGKVDLQEGSNRSEETLTEQLATIVAGELKRLQGAESRDAVTASVDSAAIETEKKRDEDITVAEVDRTAEDDDQSQQPPDLPGRPQEDDDDDDDNNDDPIELVVEDVVYEDESGEEDEVNGFERDVASQERQLNGADPDSSGNGGGNSETAAEQEVSDEDLVSDEDEEEIEEIIEYVDNTDEEGEEVIEINGNA